MAKSELEIKCYLPDCTRTPASVMTASNGDKALSFYASRMHEKAVWKFAAREYGLNGYSLRVANIARADENQ